MSSVAAQNDGAAVPADEGHTHGPTDQQYFKIFWVLFVLTALEVSTHWWTDWFGDNANKVAIPLLFVLMGIKFLLVAGYFMHLKFDAKLLNRMFYGTMVVSMVLYIAALTSMNFFSGLGPDGWGNEWINDPAPDRPLVELEADGAGG